jgi:hypothetical protein
MPDYSAFHPSGDAYPATINSFMDKVGDDLEYMTWDVRIKEDKKLIFGASYATGAAFYWDSGDSEFVWGLEDNEVANLAVNVGSTSFHIYGAGTEARLRSGKNQEITGYLDLFGGDTGVQYGGTISLQVAKDYGSTTFWVAALEDDFWLGPSGALLKYDGGLGHWTLADHLQLGDSVAVLLGAEAGGDSQIQHTGTALTVDNDTGAIYIRANDTGGDVRIYATTSGDDSRVVYDAIGAAVAYPVMYREGSAIFTGVPSDGVGVKGFSSNTATPSGATIKQLKIYDETGTVAGYIPVYENPWS